MNIAIYPSLRSRLISQHESISVFYKTVTKHLLHTKPQPGKWSIHDHIAHLTRYQQIFIGRIHQVLLTNEPILEQYKAENDPDFIPLQSNATEKLLQQLNKDRSTIISLIDGLDTDQMARCGKHPKYGLLAIPDWIEFFILHEAHHLYAIFQLIKSHEAPK